MALLKRLSDSFWTLVSSPVNTTSHRRPRQKRVSLDTSPTLHKQPTSLQHGASLDRHVRAKCSMSPKQRIARWSIANKRKIEDGDSPTLRSRRRKLAVDRYESRTSRSRVIEGGAKQSDDEDEQLEDIHVYEGKDVEDDGYESDEIEDHIATSQDQSIYDEGSVADDISDEIVMERNNRRFREEGSLSDFDEDEIHTGTPRHSSLHSDGDIIDGETTLIVSEAEYGSEQPKRKQVISLPTAQAARGVSVPDLQAAGWDDDNIMLRQKIAMRGYEPLMPAYHKFEFRWLPDELFSSDGNAFLSSCSGSNFHASKALEKLFELGARARDCATAACTSTRPDQRIRKTIEAYARWAETDAQLDPASTVPLFTIVNKRAGHPALAIKLRARRKLEDLAARHRAALTVARSIESASPLSTTTSELKHLLHPLPTLYAFVTSSTILSLSAWRPGEPDMDIKPIAVFNLALQDYDVWNALAVAITIVHLRDIQLRIVEQTGIGYKGPVTKTTLGVDNDPDR
nr:hypothetical protein CFP56_12267 [Quercus suber]